VSYEAINVIAYSSYKGEERPLAFLLDDKKIEVEKILRFWIEEGRGDRKRRRLFVFRGNDKQIHKIYYDEESFQWFYVEAKSY
jgi:hypothetical protein